jgi:hypothetical protein
MKWWEKNKTSSSEKFGISAVNDEDTIKRENAQKAANRINKAIEITLKNGKTEWIYPESYKKMYGKQEFGNIKSNVKDKYTNMLIINNISREISNLLNVLRKHYDWWESSDLGIRSYIVTDKISGIKVKITISEM